MMKSAIEWFLGKPEDTDNGEGEATAEPASTAKDVNSDTANADNDSSKENFLNGHFSGSLPFGTPHSPREFQKRPYEEHVASPWGCSLTPKSPKFASRVSLRSLSPPGSKSPVTARPKIKPANIWEDLGLTAEVESPGFAPRVVRSVKSYNTPDGLKKYPISQSKYIGSKALPNVKLKGRPQVVVSPKKAHTMPLLPLASSPVSPFSSLSTGFLSSTQSRIPDLTSVISVLDSPPKSLPSDSIRDPASVQSVVAALQQAQNAKSGVKRMRHLEPEDANKKQKCGGCGTVQGTITYASPLMSQGSSPHTTKEPREGREKRPLDLSPSPDEEDRPTSRFQLSPENKRRCIPDPRIASFSSSKNVVNQMSSLPGSGRESPFSIYESKGDSDSESNKSIDSHHSRQSEHSLREQMNDALDHHPNSHRELYDRSESQTPQSTRGSYGLNGAVTTTNGSRSSSRTTTPPRPSHSFSLEAHKADKARSQQRLNKMLGRLFNVSDEEILISSTSSSSTGITTTPSVPESFSSQSLFEMPASSISSSSLQMSASINANGKKLGESEAISTFKAALNGSSEDNQTTPPQALSETSNVLPPSSSESIASSNEGFEPTKDDSNESSGSTNTVSNSSSVQTIIAADSRNLAPTLSKEDSEAPISVSFTFTLPPKSTDSLANSAKPVDTAESAVKETEAKSLPPPESPAFTFDGAKSQPTASSNVGNFLNFKPPTTSSSDFSLVKSSKAIVNTSSETPVLFGTSSALPAVNFSSVSNIPQSKPLSIESGTPSGTGFAFGDTAAPKLSAGFNFNSKEISTAPTSTTASQAANPLFTFGTMKAVSSAAISTNPTSTNITTFLSGNPKPSEIAPASSAPSPPSMFTFGQSNKPEETSSPNIKLVSNPDSMKNFSFSLAKSSPALPTTSSSFLSAAFSFTSAAGSTTTTSTTVSSTVSSSNMSSPFTFGATKSTGSQFKFGSETTPSMTPIPAFGASGGFSSLSSAALTTTTNSTSDGATISFGASTGSSSALTAPSVSSSGFTFGKPASTQAGFNFGSSQSKPEEKVPLFTFGSNSNSSAFSPPTVSKSGFTSSTFNFGQSGQATSAPSFGNQTSSSQFGTNNSSSNKLAFGAKSPAEPPAFGGGTASTLFGGQSKNLFSPAGGNPIFGSQSDASTGGTVPTFGGGTDKNASASSPFQFGQAANSTSPFSFGQSQSQSTSPAGVFQFGSSTNNPPVPQFGTPTPQFGSSSSSGVPQFGTSSSNTGVLQFGSSPVPIPQFGTPASNVNVPQFGTPSMIPNFTPGSSGTSTAAARRPRTKGTRRR